MRTRVRWAVRWAARLYPAAWRKRYGEELEALLEDVGPGGRDLWDLVRGALFMRMTSVSFWKILTGCMLAGVLAAGIWSLALPKRYVSTAVMRISVWPAATPASADMDRRMTEQIQLQRLQQATISRSSLTSIITGQNLYPNERSKYPLEDIVQGMRKRDLRIRTVETEGGTAFTVEFASDNPAAAQATVRAIVTAFTEQNAQVSRQSGNGVTNMEVLNPASLPSQPAGPNRMRMIGNGLGAGLVLGLVCGAIWSIVRRKEQLSFGRIGGFAAAGMAVGLTIAFLIPDEFISTAVLRIADGGKLQSAIREVLSDDSLAAIVRQDGLFPRELSRGSMNDVVRKMRNEHIRVNMVQAGPAGNAFAISFRYPDRWQAQRVTRQLMTRFITGAPQPATGVGDPGSLPQLPWRIRDPQVATMVLDPASLPQSPSSPNRLLIAVLGTVAGILLGLGASRFRRPKLAAV
jgi:hypothetical protein